MKRTTLALLMALLISIPVGVCAIHYVLQANLNLESKGLVMELKDSEGTTVTELQGPSLWIGESNFVIFSLQNSYDSTLSVSLNATFCEGFCLGSANTYRYKLNAVGDFITVELGDVVEIPTAEFIEIKLAIYNYNAEVGTEYNAMIEVNVDT